MSADTLKTLKAMAKTLARKKRIQHIASLEIVARRLGQRHWRGLSEAYKIGWRPTEDQIADLKNFFRGTPPNQATATSGTGSNLVFTRWSPKHLDPLDGEETEGELDGHRFYLVGDEFSVAFGSQGWEIILDQAPLAQPEVRRLGGRVKSAEALDPLFIERAISLLKRRAQVMYAKVARDWPRRSTMPDHDGQALHPLDRGLSAEWHCLHCEGVHSGRTMASNLWHCPDCAATPIDLFPTKWWGESRQSA